MRKYFIGATTVIVGIVLQVLVVRLNGGMPATGINYPHGDYVPITDTTKLVFLSDVIPTSPWTYSSIGDILMIAGLVIMIVACIKTWKNKNAC